jgi:hypothetical protein
MEVGLRSTGKPVEKLPNPGATAPRFYSTNKSENRKVVYFFTDVPLFTHFFGASVLAKKEETHE